MCGIIGFTGYRNCTDILIKGLEKMEYRGYDSAGLAVIENGKLAVRKSVGRIAALSETLSQQPVEGTIGLGHTRWATHGVPSFRNSHPHVDMNETVAVVHNGIIENYFSLKNDLIEKGVKFTTETDTEVVAQMIGYYYNGDMLETLKTVLPALQGTYALGIVSTYDPDVIYCTRKESPLIVGKGTDGNYLASDAAAILEHTRDVYFLDNLDIAKISKNKIEFFDTQGNPIEKEIERITWSAAAAEKAGYDHFMLKEIFEQPKAIADTLGHYVDAAKLELRRELMPFTQEEAMALPKISIVACGTAYHAGIVGKALIEKLARIPVDVKVASEFRYGDAIIAPGEVFVAVSQSGETADTIAAIKRAKEYGSRVVSLCNVIGSTVARESDAVLYTMAGPEIAVASTKAYTTQVLLFTLIALDLAHLRGLISDLELREKLNELLAVPKKAELMLLQQESIKTMAQDNLNCKNVFFIGRQLDYALSMEAALKLKEISYLHSEAYAAGELKHGTIALIEEGTLVVASATQDGVFEKTMSSIEEVRVRGAKIITLLGHNHKPDVEVGKTVALPECSDIYTPMLAVIPMQLFAYYMALERGCDIDKPRNLAKSVTVE